MSYIKELESTLLDQIEKLSDDSLFEDKEKAEILINKSKAMAELTNNVMQINNFKLECVKESNKNGGLYDYYLGIEAPKHGKV